MSYGVCFGWRYRWYGPGEPQAVQLERKTYRESWKGDESQKERMTLPEPKVGLVTNESAPAWRQEGRGDQVSPGAGRYPGGCL